MELTKNQLKTYNGKGGNKSYISYNNELYDVTEIFHNGEQEALKKKRSRSY